MRGEKEKRRVDIMLLDGSFVRGTIFINLGERVMDFFNDPKESFIAVTNIESSSLRTLQSFKLAQPQKKKNTFIINKTAIKCVEEI
ncbi:MAG: hypothetical protein AB1481_02590 [Candidatus Omnitrophota bacterium]